MIEQFEMVAKAAGDSSRTRILKMLEADELCVCQITAVLDLAPATVSKHLSVLKLAGLVFQRKEGRWVYYRLADRPINPYALSILASVRELICEDGQVAADRERLQKVSAIPLDILCAKGVDGPRKNKTKSKHGSKPKTKR
ncbi:MAG: helix-turn-helix transcriptional regulator [Rhodospirillales bacterium]|jgi:DNA-binding transcriptional ArsR family regulator|nr:helix-turn-helix transcriptional regulator [Rhodospirillales bacterium]